MLRELGRLADRVGEVVLEGPREASARGDDAALHPVGIVVAVVVLAVSIVAFATAMALALDHLMEGALTFTLARVS
jgi:hypothetical protein